MDDRRILTKNYRFYINFDGNDAHYVLFHACIHISQACIHKGIHIVGSYFESIWLSHIGQSSKIVDDDSVFELTAEDIIGSNKVINDNETETPKEIESKAPNKPIEWKALNLDLVYTLYTYNALLFCFTD